MILSPNATIPLYPRDYIFLDSFDMFSSRFCFGFEYLGDRIILGGIFMRNFDILFDKNNKIVKMTRADCSSEKNFDFEKFYMHHKDMPTDFTVPKSNADLIVEWSFSFVEFLASIGIFVLTLYWRLFIRRYR